jgi:N-ethylmaleimide reductase
MAFFQPLKLGSLTLPNRIIMAPLTRCRATPGTNAPNAMMAQMYAERASAGLLIAEATVISEEARGFPNTPGAYSAEQTAGWKLVTDAVHAKGGRIFLQLWHQGRTASKDLNGGLVPVGPSPQADGSWANGFGGRGGEAREATLEDIARIIGDYKLCAQNAMAAGFDGVELHAANGYAPNQFLVDGVNKRTDAFGGSIANRARFLEEALDACIAACGAERVGVRLSPASHWQDIQDSDPLALYTHVGRMLAGKAGLAYLHVVEPRDTGLGAPPTDPVDLQLTASFFRTTCGFPGAVLSAGGHSMESGQQFLQSGACDAVVFGRHYISNPDLVERFKAAADSGKEPVLTPYDRATFYASGPEGCE